MALLDRLRARLARHSLEKRREDSELYTEYNQMYEQMQESIAGKTDRFAADTARMLDGYFEVEKEKKGKNNVRTV